MSRELRLCIALVLGSMVSAAMAPTAIAEGGKKCQKRHAAKPSEQQPRRFGTVIELKPEKKDLYLQLHENTWRDVLDCLRESNIQNYTIYMTELGGKTYLFAYFEYTGDDLKADMAKMKRNRAMQLWWTLTDPCQRRLPGTPNSEQWRAMPEVFRMD